VNVDELVFEVGVFLLGGILSALGTCKYQFGPYDTRELGI